VRQWYDKLDKRPSSFMFKSWLSVRVHAKDNLPLSKDFGANECSHDLAPIVMSHGLTANKFLYQTTCIEMASFGHLVLIIDHLDGSGTFTKTENGEILKFNTSMPRNEFKRGEAGHLKIEQMVE
jgi:hypothetical protein